jgi:hypothetical protein
MYAGVEHDDGSDDSGYMFLWNSMLELTETEAIWTGEPALDCAVDVKITIPRKNWDLVRIMFI